MTPPARVTQSITRRLSGATWASSRVIPSARARSLNSATSRRPSPRVLPLVVDGDRHLGRAEIVRERDVARDTDDRLATGGGSHERFVTVVVDSRQPVEVVLAEMGGQGTKPAPACVVAQPGEGCGQGVAVRGGERTDPDVGRHPGVRP